MESKVCCVCKEEKPLTEFHRRNTSSYQRECKACSKARKSLWNKTERGKLSSANSKLKSRFGISMDEYAAMLDAQNGECLICGSKESYLGHRLAVDHCHSTGRIRGLLCKGCNVGLGNFNDDPSRLLKAAQYLTRNTV